MNIVTSVSEWNFLRQKMQNKSIGFVHTMGNLHAGHLSLCLKSQQDNEITICAIFVNPTQFNENEDFINYPRTLEKDKNLLIKQKIDYLLLLDKKDIYADDFHVKICETSELSQILEGEFRPGHLQGMLTVVLKFLNIVKPIRSYYGEKDYQQLLLIKKMVQALFLEIEIIACPIVRAQNGLALSSRNTRLTLEELDKASCFAKLLKKEQDSDYLIEQLKNLEFKVDYVADKWNRRLAAVWLSNVRLIDNVPLALFR